MIILLYGQDTYRCLQKLNEIINHYHLSHQSGLNLKHLDLEKDDYESFESEIRSTSILTEKKLLVLRNASLNESFKANFLKNSKRFSDSEDIIVFFEGEISEQDKFFKFLKQSGKFQRFQPLGEERLKYWVKKEFAKEKVKIEPQALNQLIHYVRDDLWRFSGEIKKLISYKIKEKTPLIKREDVDLLVRSETEGNIFQTIDALAARNKKEALSLIHQHLERGDSPLYLLAMINFQFRNLLMVKSQNQLPSDTRMHKTNHLRKELKMHPYVIKKTSKLASRFSLEELKRIYQKIFQVDLEIKTGRIDPTTALDVLIAEI